MLNLIRNVCGDYSDEVYSYTNYLKELNYHLPVPNELNKFHQMPFTIRKLLIYDYGVSCLFSSSLKDF